LALGHPLPGKVIDPPIHRLADFGAESAGAECWVFREKLAVDPGGAWRGYLRLDRQIGSGGERQALAAVGVVVVHPRLDDRAGSRVAGQFEIGEAEVVRAPIAADARQLDNLKDAVRASMAWGEMVRDTERLNLTQSDSALAKAKLAEANETMKTRLKEAWCYLHYPAQESAQANVEWVSGKIPAQDGLLARASKKLVAEEGLLIELGPTRLDRDLQKYIWNGKPHLSLKDLREYLNRYTYLPRLKNQEVLTKAVKAAVSGIVPGPFASAERWDEKSDAYLGLAIDRAGNAAVVIDSDSVIVSPAVAEAHRPAPPQPGTGAAPTGFSENVPGTGVHPAGGPPTSPQPEKKPTRFTGAVMISSERPARDMHQIVEAIVEQLTTLPGSQVKLRLEIEAEVPSGLDRAKVRTLVENANTLGFIEKSIE
jgi:hypothetical protein